MERCPVEVRVWGEYACWTRPAMKVERVSYPVMTPSAARGLLEAIFWKPEFRWEVTEIAVLSPIRYLSICRNEVKEVGMVSLNQPVMADDPRIRTQRNTVVLRDVNYIIRAQVRLESHATAPEAKYRAQFRRRVERGQCYHRPYLGCREFVAYFEPPRGPETPIPVSMDLGRMFFDRAFVPSPRGRVFFTHPIGRRSEWVRAESVPSFFDARLEQGILHVPSEMYEEVRRAARGAA